MAPTPKENFIQKIAAVKTGAEAKLQALGGRIRRNVAQGQKDFDSGKMPYYGTINPFKK